RRLARQSSSHPNLRGERNGGSTAWILCGAVTIMVVVCLRRGTGRSCPVATDSRHPHLRVRRPARRGESGRGQSSRAREWVLPSTGAMRWRLDVLGRARLTCRTWLFGWHIVVVT